MIRICDKAYHKNIDKYTMSEIGIPGIVLMERAAYALVQEVKKSANQHTRILAVCGNGNNGGDGIAAARILWQSGYSCDVFLAQGEKNLSEETERQRSIAHKLGIPILIQNTDKKVLNEELRKQISNYDIIIDAIFGIGLSREITGICAELIACMNQSGAKIFAADIPSGVHADTGAVCDSTVKADVTVSFGYGKPGLYLYPGASYAGIVKTCEIGFSERGTPETEIFAYEGVHELPLPVRSADSHKGSYGKVLVIAGFSDMSGACCMAAEAAYRSGAGLVRVFTSEASMRALQARIPELMVSSCDRVGWQEELSQLLSWTDVIAIGPGLLTDHKAEQVLRMVLSDAEKQLVMDADAINLMAGKIEEIPKKTILTPHPAELSRLLGIPMDQIKKDRIGILRQWTNQYDLVFVCKDARTVISQGNRFCININGNNGMATGGSGDVLTGIIAALVASGMTPFDAACAGVRIHAEAGDYAAERKSKHALMATDIISMLPEVFSKIEMGKEQLEK